MWLLFLPRSLPPSRTDGQTTATDFPFGRSDSSLNLENWNAISDHLGRGKEERTPRTKVECSVDRGRRCRCRSRTFVRERKEERRTLRPRPSVRPSTLLPTNDRRNRAARGAACGWRRCPTGLDRRTAECPTHFSSRLRHPLFLQ